MSHTIIFKLIKKIIKCSFERFAIPLFEKFQDRNYSCYSRSILVLLEFHCYFSQKIVPQAGCEPLTSGINTRPLIFLTTYLVIISLFQDVDICELDNLEIKMLLFHKFNFLVFSDGFRTIIRLIIDTNLATRKLLIQILFNLTVCMDC